MWWQYKHFRLSQQHFANFGYLSNADINEDKCLMEILKKDMYWSFPKTKLQDMSE